MCNITKPERDLLASQRQARYDKKNTSALSKGREGSKDMIRFECDYGEGAHPKILEALVETNLEQTEGYGLDPHCNHARELIRQACQAPEAGVEFLVGGTQANATVIAAILRPYQGALCAQTGHINVHETGAVEASGHKVLPLPAKDGKITAQAIRQACETHWGDATHEHMVQPGLVYLSQPTEEGTLYTRSELEDIRSVCDDYHLPLYIDGARCGYGLGAEENDVALADLARLASVFYIGGTKVGALFGEAVVIPDPAIRKDFRYMVKRMGGMLAKGRLLGIQFEVLFQDGLYEQLGRRAVSLAQKLADAFEAKDIPMLHKSPTNQQFPILTKQQRDKLGEKYAFSFWQQLDEDRAAVRFCTSWATREEDVDALMADIQNL